MKVSAIAHRQANESFIQDGYQRFREIFQDMYWEPSNTHADIILFLSGGSEQDAIKLLKPGNMTLLLAAFDDNAFAAAMEVKAWADENNRPVILLPLGSKRQKTADKYPTTIQTVNNFEKACKAFETLKGKKAGLIGQVSHWLVASDVAANRYKQQFGVDLVHLPWKNLPSYTDMAADQAFLTFFNKHPSDKLQAEASIHSFLKQVISDHGLNAMSLECFEMVNDRDVTACLSLAMFNSQGFPAACEGDLVSLAGLMLIQALTGEIPWMANVAAINHESILFAHCTAPLNMLSEFSINTHFETDKSAAIQGRFKADQVTIFRMNDKLNKAFIASGQVISRPELPYACRTQTEIAMDLHYINTLKKSPLGNHHLIIPGNHTELLHLACQMKQIKCLE